MNDHDLVRQLTGWRQTTAEILYRMPDHPGLVQTFLWQELDRWNDDPRLTFPRLRRFCDWWNANLDGADRSGARRCCTGDHSRRTTTRRCRVAPALR